MMKKMMLAALLAIAAQVAVAQDAIPEFKNKVMLHTKANTVENLDNTTLTRGMKGKPGKGTVFMKADGQNAAVVFDPKSGNDFIVKIEPGVDPESIVTLYVFDVDKKSRNIVTGEVGMRGSKDVVIPTVKLNFKKVQDGVYSISPVKSLGPGEYIFTVSQPVNISLAMDVKGFAFSVPE